MSRKERETERFLSFFCNFSRPLAGKFWKISEILENLTSFCQIFSQKVNKKEKSWVFPRPAFPLYVRFIQLGSAFPTVFFEKLIKKFFGKLKFESHENLGPGTKSPHNHPIPCKNDAQILDVGDLRRRGEKSATYYIKTTT